MTQESTVQRAKHRVVALPARVARSLRRRYETYRQERAIARENDRVISAARRSGREIWLELGSGPRKGTDGWITFDFPVPNLEEGADLSGNLYQPLPFNDGEVSRIYCSHVLEHFHIRDLMKLLRECHRILRPGGVMSIAVPNARIWSEGYTTLPPLIARASLRSYRH